MMIESFDMMMVSAGLCARFSPGGDMMNWRLTSGNHVGSLQCVAVPIQDESRVHSAASRSAPPQLDPWPAVHP
jgi:hypothetical protein